jgi:enoyl-[acyl-carrier protein] reductase II
VAENQGVTNRIQSLLGVEYPVVQAPMTYIARAELAAAVSDGGGMGIASHEAAVHPNFKNAIMAAGDDGTVMLDLPGNPTMRVLRTGLAASVANTGQVSSRIIDLQPASRIVKQTWSEIETALGESRSRLGERGVSPVAG